MRRALSGALAHWRLFNLSLADKCRMLFGLAVLLIVAVALSVPWYRMDRLVEQQKREQARAVADAFLTFQVHGKYAGVKEEMRRYYVSSDPRRDYPEPTLVKLAGKRDRKPQDKLTQRAINIFRDPDMDRVDEVTPGEDGRWVYQYVQAVRARPACMDCHQQVVPGEQYRLGQLVAVIRLNLPAEGVDQQLWWNRAVIVAAVALATLCAIAVFYLITHWLILAPIDQLRQVADQVASGETNTRVNLQTGDEFEEFGAALNQMLDHLEESHRKLETINKSLDARVGELSEANVALDEANRIKTEFLANVSHELRTPLNSIIGFADLLQAYPELKEHPKAQRYLVNILTSARSLLSIINELLDLAKIEAGKMELNIEKLALADLCENLYNFVTPLADKKHLQVDLAIEDQLPIMQTDAGKLQQILYNLLSNAIKFTPEGGEITMAAQTVPPEQVRISITDTGPGVPEDQQTAIFEKFRQIDGSESRQHTGAGLGLAIAKELTVMLGGSIAVASTAGQGATFSVTLPLTAPTDSPPDDE